MSEPRRGRTPGGISGSAASARRPLRRTGAAFDRRTGFELGADLLRINVDALVTLYDKTIAVMDHMVKSGVANGMLAYFGTLGYYDLLHGGAYACSISERPWHIGTSVGGIWQPTGSKYDPGPIELPSLGIADWLTNLFAGRAASPTELFDEVIVDANCPHIFPKLLSDESFALAKLGLAYSTGTELFKQGATGLQTLVNAETQFVRENVRAAREAVETIPKGVAGLQALLPLLTAGA